MRKLTHIAAIALTSALAAPAVLANGAGLGISNAASPHNFATEGWNFRGEICRVCHVPHDHDRATQLWTNGLLWNHQLSSQAYTMYSSSSLDGAQDAQPTGISKMCLGCHDGTVGIDQFDSAATNPATAFISDFNPGFQVPGASVSPSLQGTHPISIVYDNTADPNLNDPATTPMADAGNGTDSGMIADVLDGGKVQCSSCHDVHDAAGEAVAGTHLLRVGNSTSVNNASGLCLTCHKK